MGALSSWAMLAITHHVIVHVAAMRCNLPGFSNYCILGDDIVINDDRVAEEYLIIMDHLGVSINLSKSLISDKFCEFAKRLEGPSKSYTPLGPGLVLCLLRDKAYIVPLMRECVRLGLVNTLDSVLEMLASLPSSLEKKSKLALYSVLNCFQYGVQGHAYVPFQVSMS